MQRSRITVKLVWFAIDKVTTLFDDRRGSGRHLGLLRRPLHRLVIHRTWVSAGGWWRFPDAVSWSAYLGGNFVGITAGESENPQVTLRSAVLSAVNPDFTSARFCYRLYLPVGSNRLRSPVRTDVCQDRYFSGGNYQFGADGGVLRIVNSGYSCGCMLYALAKIRQLPVNGKYLCGVLVRCGVANCRSDPVGVPA